MAQTFHLSIITPEREFYSGEAVMVTAPGTLGEFGVLAGHAPFISTLKAGILTFEEASGVRRRIAVLEGIAEVTQDHCAILAEVAQSLEDISKADAESQLSTAKEAVELAYTDEMRLRAKARLTLAEIVAKVA